MRVLVVSSVGTSVLTKTSLPREVAFATANLTEAELDPEARRKIGAALTEARALLAAADDGAARRASAELNGLLGYAGGRSGLAGTHHILVCTDTAQGRGVGAILSDWLIAAGASVDVRVISELATSDLTRFRVGLSRLARELLETVPDYRTDGYRIVFNLSGGFKAVQGFLQTLGNLHADESIYIFEASEPVLSIPRLPIRLDADGVVRANLAAFRRLALGYGVTPAEKAAIPETLLFELDDGVMLSEWGTLLFESLKPELYRESILPPVREDVVLAPAFLDEARDLPPDRREIVNRRLDDLTLATDPKKRTNPNSLSLKPLQGKPIPGATHQFYLWQDREGARGFGRFDGARFTVTAMGPHLK